MPQEARERKAERRTHIVGAPRPSVSAVVAACLWCVMTGLCGLVAGDGRTQRYDQGEHVVLWHNKVGPFENPQETYSYDTLPWCEKEPDQVTTRWAGLGEALEGNALEASDYAIRFGENTPRTTVCAMVLDADAAQTFRFAVENHYFANLVLDELPIWAMVGEARASGNGTGSTEFFLFTHKRFSIARNRDRLIEVNMTNENPVRIEANARMALSYEVSWLNTSKAFSQRFRRFLDEDFFEHQIHWFSIFNSFMMVIFLVGLVGLILMRTLKSDLHRYTRNLDEEDALGGDADDTGWKQVQSDVFRFPPYLPLLCGLLGTGVQLILMVYFTTIFCLLGDLYIGRGAISATAVMVYAVASVAGGFVSARFYVQSRGTAWVKTMLVTACGFSGAVVGVSALLNTLAIAWSSLAAIPFGTIVIIFLIWFLLSCPLVLLGTVIGRNTASPFVPPTRISQIPRQIPEKRWYLQPYVMVPVGGLLPFGSIFIEMYFIFTSFWHYKFYYVYGFALLVFSILLVVSACVSIVMTYFLLNAEDYRWPWAVSRVFARESAVCHTPRPNADGDFAASHAGLPVVSFDRHLCLPVCHLLLLGANQDVRPISNLLLLRADQRAVSGCRHRVWHHGLPRSTSICLSNLQGYERRLSHCVALSLAKNEVPTHEHLNKINKSDGTLKEMNALFAPAQILLLGEKIFSSSVRNQVWLPASFTLHVQGCMKLNISRRQYLCSGQRRRNTAAD